MSSKLQDKNKYEIFDVEEIKGSKNDFNHKKLYKIMMVNVLK